MATRPAIAPEIIVFVATTESLKSEAFSVEPALNANQQKNNTMVPIIAIGISWPGNARDVPSFLNFPILGPMTSAPASASIPPIECTTAEPAKSTTPWPRPKFLPRVESQPPPHTQLAKNGYKNIEIKNEVITTAEYFTRSAIAPVGIVTVVSMNTIWKKKRA